MCKVNEMEISIGKWEMLGDAVSTFTGIAFVSVSVSFFFYTFTSIVIECDLCKLCLCQ